MTHTLSESEVQALAQAHACEPGGLLPLLHDIQDRMGFIPPESVGAIARAFNRSRAEVHGVISFYHHFRSASAGRHVVQLCRAEACRSCGSEALAAVAEKTLGCRSGETSDKGVTLESVYCLGLCASSPAISVDGQPHARMDEAQLQSLLHSLEAGV
jgi:formate dehydrogenase subunit gamma